MVSQVCPRLEEPQLFGRAPPVNALDKLLARPKRENQAVT